MLVHVAAREGVRQVLLLDQGCARRLVSCIENVLEDIRNDIPHTNC